MNPAPAAEHTLHQPKAPNGPARSARLRWVVPIITFVCGCVAGAGVTFKLLDDRMLGMMRRPGPEPERIISKLKSELDLTPDQIQSVTKIVREHDAEMQNLHREIHPRMDARVRLFNDEISSVLDERQRVIWKARVERMRSMFPPPPSDDGLPAKE